MQKGNLKFFSIRVEDIFNPKYAGFPDKEMLNQEAEALAKAEDRKFIRMLKRSIKEEEMLYSYFDRSFNISVYKDDPGKLRVKVQPSGLCRLYSHSELLATFKHMDDALEVMVRFKMTLGAL